MSTNDPVSLSVCELSSAITAQKISPVEVVEAYLERIAALDGKLGAFTDVFSRDARLAAEAAHKAISANHRVGPLHGVPIVLKDLIEIEDRIVTGGSKNWENRRSESTAPLVRRLLSQGMIILGKTRLVEFALGGWGTNSRMGTPWNPWDMTKARIPGGSSSGSGVAVAASLAPWAIGTDTGGSVRLPASFCGITGLKVTEGKISTEGLLPLSPTLDTPGPITRSASDARLLFQAMREDCGVGDGTAHSRRWRRDLQGLRLGVIPEAERTLVSPDQLDAYDASVETAANGGAEIVDLTLPFTFEELAEINGRIMSSECYALWGSLAEDRELPLDENVRPRVLAGKGISARDYLSALDLRDSLKKKLAEAWAETDALLTPTTLTTAIPVEDVDETKAPAHFTRFANLLNLSALAIPNGFDPHGLPTSLQIVTRDEDTALHIGEVFQQMTDWHAQRPDMLS